VSRFLFVVPPLTGHVNPTIAVGRELSRRGHEVAWAGHGDIVGPLLPPGSQLFSLGDAGASDFFRPALEKSQRVRGLESLQFLWETLLVPLARAMRPRIAQLIASYRPDALIVDQQALGGALAARAAGLPWASFSTTSAGVTDPLAPLPKVQAWVDGQLAMLEKEAGLLPAPGTAANDVMGTPTIRPPPDLSPHCAIVFSTDALVGPLDRFPPHFHFVGPSIADRPDATPFPWEQLSPDLPRVLVSLGTISPERGGDFYAVCVEALGGGPWQIVLVAPAGRVPAPPANFLVRPRVPQLALLPHCRAVICHAGHNTTVEALAHGLPLVVAPIRDDQPVIAEQVVRAGAGVRVKFGRLTPAALREALEHVLGEPSFAQAAGRVRDSFAAAGGASAAADHLERLVPSRPEPA